jgi:hypothetical protein
MALTEFSYNLKVKTLYTYYCKVWSPPCWWRLVRTSETSVYFHETPRKLPPSMKSKNLLRQVNFVQTSSGAHPASCKMGTGGPFPRAKRGRGVPLTTHPNLVLRSRMSRSYISSHLKCHHGV